MIDPVAEAYPGFLIEFSTIIGLLEDIAHINPSTSTSPSPLGSENRDLRIMHDNITGANKDKRGIISMDKLKDTVN
jgi:hypothetical protein